MPSSVVRTPSPRSPRVTELGLPNNRRIYTCLNSSGHPSASVLNPGRFDTRASQYAVPTSRIKRDLLGERGSFE